MKPEAAIFPEWVQEFLRFLPARSGFILHGNIQDYQAYPLVMGEGGGVWRFFDLEYFLHRLLRDQGYEVVVFYDMVDGFRSMDGAEGLARFRDLGEGHPVGSAAGARGSQGAQAAQAGGGATPPPSGATSPPPDPKRWVVAPGRAAAIIRQAMANPRTSVAAVISLASRLIGDPQNLAEPEREMLANLWKGIREARQAGQGGQLRNLTVLLADKANDLPPWLYLENPFCKLISVERPDSHSRRRYIDASLPEFSLGKELPQDKREEAKGVFTDLTEGMTNADLEALRLISLRAGVAAGEMRSLVDLYRYGVRRSPWDDLDPSRLAKAESDLARQVIGQGQAVRETLDILKRARVGLAGVQQSLRSHRPKGILFFAGPTGVGKTLLAKSMANLLFSDEQACLRFDMSEYSREHSDQRLLGAPPGYVGYEAGGQLTRAVQRRPFSVLLFDEIEKAHPSLFDKFLQIIDDGRLTDGRGETVYFSEAVLIFTSNLGTADVSPDLGYSEVRTRVLAAIRDFFIGDLGRPEILNRFGENFVVFDYIRRDSAERILAKMIENTAARLAETIKVDLAVAAPAHQFLLERSLGNLEFGGRGIGNVVEKCLVNPLARYIFDHGVKGPCRLEVLSIVTGEDGAVSVDCAATPCAAPPEGASPEGGAP